MIFFNDIHQRMYIYILAIPLKYSTYFTYSIYNLSRLQVLIGCS